MIRLEHSYKQAANACLIQPVCKQFQRGIYLFVCYILMPGIFIFCRLSSRLARNFTR